MKQRVLVISAHRDDESFGCLGTLLKHKEVGDTIAFLWFTSARETFNGKHALIQFFNAEYQEYFWEDQQFDTRPLKQFIDVVENAIWTFKPTIVYTNFIGDLNRDHRIVAEATMVACRPYKENAPREVWMYRIPGSTELGLREFYRYRMEIIDPVMKTKLIDDWYPGERINGRKDVSGKEYFEKWPICYHPNQSSCPNCR